MPTYALVVAIPVLRQLRNFTRDERREIRRLLGIIQLDPSVDHFHKIIAPRPPVIFTAYVSPVAWIFYRVVNNTIHIELIERPIRRFPAPS